ncbi:MAG: hypothetical protein HQM12_03580 [SAR324 cluster bacterium]|nr:hypothetical protein [SAR324 cluster bacterium]
MFDPNHIQSLIFDLNHLVSHSARQEWTIFEQILQVLIERDYHIILISQEIPAFNYHQYEQISLIQSATIPAIANNTSLLQNTTFWVTNDPEVQEKLGSVRQIFAGSTLIEENYPSFQFQQLHDILYMFHPSQNTADYLAQQIIKTKQKAESIPLIVGVGGPEDCGHAYFIGPLVDALENHDVLLAGLDLTEILGTEFQASTRAGYWHSQEIRDWMLNTIILPFSKGERVFIESAPDFIEPYEISVFPLFIAPEMVLLLWGTTIFLPELSCIDSKILLDLSPKSATARMFGLDDRQNFSPEFVQNYETHDQQYYAEYLSKYNVFRDTEHLVDFNNFHAFRLKQR